MLIKDANNDEAKKFDAFKEIIESFLKVKNIDFLETSEAPASAINVHGKMKVLIPLEGLIDPKKELERIQKVTGKLTAEGNSISSKLENKNFIKNAPKDLVAQLKDRSDYITNQINNLDIQFKEINKLV